VGDAEERPGEPDVVAAREVLVEARAERQQARDVADDVDRALVRLDDPGEHLEQRALAGAVGPMTARLSPWTSRNETSRSAQKWVGPRAFQQVAERRPDGRLAGQPEVVADAEAWTSIA
jgi:hypothetical protein